MKIYVRLTTQPDAYGSDDVDQGIAVAEQLKVLVEEFIEDSWPGVEASVRTSTAKQSVRAHPGDGESVEESDEVECRIEEWIQEHWTEAWDAVEE